MKRLIEAVDGKGARTNRRKHLSAMCSWAVDQAPALLPSNPVRDSKAGRTIKTSGFYTWLIPDVQQLLHFHRNQNTKRSRKAISALGLLLFAGTRRQDMVTLGKQNWRIFYGDVLAGMTAQCVGNPGAAPKWQWRCGFYPGSRPGECTGGTAATFQEARAAFEIAWRDFFSKRTEAGHGGISAIGLLRNIGALT